MNLIKKNTTTMFLNLMSVLLITISIGSITSKGLTEGYLTFYKTISFSRKPFELFGGNTASYTILNFLFFIGMFTLIVSSILFYKKQKTISIFLSVIDIIALAIVFLTFQNGNYLLMTGIVVTMIMLQILLQSISKYKLLSAVAISSSLAIWLINIYFLVKHFSMIIGMSEIKGVLLENLIKISRTNAICITLFIIPCLIYIICSAKSER